MLRSQNRRRPIRKTAICSVEPCGTGFHPVPFGSNDRRSASVLRTQDDWRYLLRYGYHCAGPYPAIDFRLEELTEAQRTALRDLLAATLREEQRECAAWHFVSPPDPPTE